MFLKTQKNGASESLKFLCPISFSHGCVVSVKAWEKSG